MFAFTSMSEYFLSTGLWDLISLEGTFTRASAPCTLHNQPSGPASLFSLSVTCFLVFLGTTDQGSCREDPVFQRQQYFLPQVSCCWKGSPFPLVIPPHVSFPPPASSTPAHRKGTWGFPAENKIPQHLWSLSYNRDSGTTELVGLNVSGPCSCTMPSSGSCLITIKRNQAICTQNGSCPSIGGRPEGGRDDNHGRKHILAGERKLYLFFHWEISSCCRWCIWTARWGHGGRGQRPEIKGARRNGWDTSVCKHHCLDLKGECTKTSSFHTKKFPWCVTEMLHVAEGKNSASRAGSQVTKLIGAELCLD